MTRMTICGLASSTRKRSGPGTADLTELNYRSEIPRWPN